MNLNLSVSRYDDSMYESWNAFLSDTKNGLFMFNRAYMDYHSDRFKDHSLIFYLDGDIIALFPANEDNGR